MRRLLPLLSALFLTFALAGSALAWAKPVLEPNCAPDPNSFAWWITLPGSESNYNFEWTFHPEVLDPSDSHTPDHWLAEGSGNAGGTAPYYFTTPRGGETLYVRWTSDHGATDSADANGELCEPPPPDAPELTFADCEEFGGDGSVTVAGLEDDVFVQINGPTVLTITADGTYPLEPGHYGYRSVFDGKALDSGTFDIGDCPPPEGEPSVDLDKFVWDEGGLVTEVTAGDPVTYTYEITNDGEVNLDIALLEDLIVSSPEADPGDVACDDFDRQADTPGNDDETFEPGETWVFTCTVDGLPVGVTDNEACVYANEVHEAMLMVPDPYDSDVYSCAEYSIEAKPEGGTGGGTGTPPQGGSIPDTALSLSNPGSPLATFAFGMLLVSALGALAFVNVRSSRR